MAIRSARRAPLRWAIGSSRRRKHPTPTASRRTKSASRLRTPQRSIRLASCLTPIEMRRSDLRSHLAVQPLHFGSGDPGLGASITVRGLDQTNDCLQPAPLQPLIDPERHSDQQTETRDQTGVQRYRHGPQKISACACAGSRYPTRPHRHGDAFQNCKCTNFPSSRRTSISASTGDRCCSTVILLREGNLDRMPNRISSAAAPKSIAMPGQEHLVITAKAHR